MKESEEDQAEHGAWAEIQSSGILDIRVRRNGRELKMLGPAGPQRELSFVRREDVLQKPVLPVLLGSGTGAALHALVDSLSKAYGQDFPLAVIDKEQDILAASGLREQYAQYPGILWLTDPDPEHVLRQLTLWQHEQDGKALLPILNPFYLRLDREYYHALSTVCEASAKANFWDKARYGKFRWKPESWRNARVLLLTSAYFLIGEVTAACDRLGLEYHLLTIPDGELGRNEFVEQLLAAVLDFKPDFALTINHLGVDREGVLTDLLARLHLPLASWFVDNPHLILSLYANLVSPWTAIFTWDADNVGSLKALGFEHVSWLPLGVDATRFSPNYKAPALALPGEWNKRVAFVGNSMLNKVDARMRRSNLPESLLAGYQEVAAGFASSSERSVRAYLHNAKPELLPAFDALSTTEEQLNYETMLTWEATLQYRLSCIHSILPYEPLLIGDAGWKELLKDAGSWHYHSEVNYYTELPLVYPQAAVNFNCTSQQMKGAVNQRVFDVPATGAFLLTDYREQVEQLFDPGHEIICYSSPTEAEALTAEYLARPDERQRVATAARKRILDEHCYEHRVRTLVHTMRSLYAQA